MLHTAFKCEACGRDFQTAEALNSHRTDRHAPSSHEAKELKKASKERLASEAPSSGSRRKRLLLKYIVLLVIFLALVGAGTILMSSG